MESTVSQQYHNSIPCSDQSKDIVLSFHQLEHIYELEEYVIDVKRVLKPEGYLVGAVLAEGGLAWGLGRFLTSRRYAKKKMKLNYDKIICWEHPNFVNKIKYALDKHFKLQYSVKKPFNYLPFDLNLSWSFIYKNSDK